MCIRDRLQQQPLVVLAVAAGLAQKVVQFRQQLFQMDDGHVVADPLVHLVGGVETAQDGYQQGLFEIEPLATYQGMAPLVAVAFVIASTT